jgi:hypothetical protein
LHAGLDLSRRRLDYCLLDEAGAAVEAAAVSPDADRLRGFVRRVTERHGPVQIHAAIESMNGAGSCTTRWNASGGRSRSPLWAVERRLDATIMA